jgi:thiol-disulfide isomerase/thioredoxin
MDPWADAQAIAQRLQQPNAELLAVLGAEAWCSKCQKLRPAFEQLASSLPAHVLPLWLDLEDHAEFLGSFIPPDLPLLLRWRQGQCVQAAVLQDIHPDATDPAQRVRLQPLVLQAEQLEDPNDGTLINVPPLWREFCNGGWAQA